ncbi:hypothetical protein M431DRAFT_226759 [Trichoderma harzianum CBS 226.95]|uniref:Uncharacterized protein n=1 Tax=Trichoderma harzianum CBS 226.95 TaxID=983964 RepID=A0A2T4A400_TRIHA|nr:hypothetical protein M431DRAFT_226759 [Trichoderma harzianum CBS 226.95]PTB51776.1 hypothetical protein M431DRAFT_226759 [Trichoderma harzianum CBS 226.95]
MVSSVMVIGFRIHLHEGRDLGFRMGEAPRKADKRAIILRSFMHPVAFQRCRLSLGSKERWGRGSSLRPLRDGSDRARQGSVILGASRATFPKPCVKSQREGRRRPEKAVFARPIIHFQRLELDPKGVLHES